VQLPFKSALATGTSRRLEDQLRAAQAGERRARARIADLEAECAKLSRADRARPVEKPNEDVYKALEQRDNWIAQLEARAATADTRADEAQSELDGARERITELEAELESARSERITELEAELESVRSERIAELEAELERVRGERKQLRDQTTEAARLLDEQRVRALAAEGEVAARDRRLGELVESAEQESAREIGELEAQLARVGTEVARLQAELKEAERIGRELVQALPQSGAEDANGAAEPSSELTAKLDALAELNALREADLAAARWVIEKLEARLEEADPSKPKAELELELAQARDVLQRQEVLLEQARRSVWRAEEPAERSGVSSLKSERSLTE
jgi:chromosome segregation ATPase